MTLILDVGQEMPWLGLGELKMHDDIAHQYRPEDSCRCCSAGTQPRSIANLFGLNLAGFGDPRFPGELSGFLG